MRPLAMLPAADPDAERSYERQQSRDLLDLMRLRLDINQRMRVGATPEAIATDVFEYMAGLVDGIVRTAPDLVDVIADQIETSMCDASTSDAELITWSRLIGSMPELANAKSFDCLFSLHSKEDAVLWFGIDAWRSSNLPKPEALAALEPSLRDSRTQRRLRELDPDQKMAETLEMLARSDDDPPPDPNGPTPRCRE